MNAEQGVSNDTRRHYQDGERGWNRVLPVTNLVEHEDGSATITLDLTNEESRILIQWAIREAIKDGIKAEKELKWDS